MYRHVHLHVHVHVHALYIVYSSYMTLTVLPGPQTIITQKCEKGIATTFIPRSLWLQYMSQKTGSNTLPFGFIIFCYNPNGNCAECRSKKCNTISVPFCFVPFRFIHHQKARFAVAVRTLRQLGAERESVSKEPFLRSKCSGCGAKGRTGTK